MIFIHPVRLVPQSLHLNCEICSRDRIEGDLFGARNQYDTIESESEVQGTMANTQDDNIIEDIQIGNQIGSGANASILEAKWEGLTVAIKDVRCILDEISGQESQRLREHFLSECRLSSCIRHPNIVRFLGVYYASGSGTKLPYIVMERLRCNLDELLMQHSVVPLEIKLHILHGISVGLRYLHTREPPVIHKDLTSENVLLSDGIEVKVTNLSTACLIPSHCYVRSSRSLDFLPVMDDPTNEITKEVNIFSFGCIMIHMFSHQWPSPSPALVNSNDPDEHQGIANSSSELDRRAQYIDKIPKAIDDVVVPLITSCLENLSGDRPTAEEVCDQLESLVVNRKCSLPDNLLDAQLVLEETQQQLKSQTAEMLQIKSELLTKRTKLEKQCCEVECLRLELSKLQLSSSLQFTNLQVWLFLNITNF